MPRTIRRDPTVSRSAVETEPGSREPPGDDQTFFGGPRGLPALSGPKVPERFSFLGMQAIPILILCLCATVAHGGMGVAAGTTARVSAAYGTLAHLASVAGGRLTDGDGGFSAAAIGMTFGLLQYVAGRRHPAGRGHAAEPALGPGAMRRAVRPIVLGLPAAAAPAVLRAAAGRPTVRFGVNGTIADASGPAVTALAPWLRRTMHPVH
jgi:dipeptide/tripeptide permease